jgi:hypothetical protein
MRVRPVHLAPLAGRGRIVLTIRVRGTLRESVSVESPPHPNPLPASGAREKWSRRATLIPCPQPIPDPSLRQHKLRTLGIGFDLLAELTHIDPQILRVGQFVP